MIAMFAGLAFAAMQTTPPDAAWTWTLYTDEARLALANEVPDTPNLRFTLECDPRSGVARVTLYGGQAETAMARVTAGEASAVTEGPIDPLDGGLADESRISLRDPTLRGLLQHGTLEVKGDAGHFKLTARGDERRLVEQFFAYCGTEAA